MKLSTNFYPVEKPRGRLSPYTIHQHFRVLRTFFNWAVKVELITESPISKVEEPKVPDEDMPVLEDEEVEQIIKAIDVGSENGLRDLAIVSLLLDTGLRRNEVVNLTCREVDLKQREVKVKWGKGGKNRIVPLLDAIEVLAAYLETRSSDLKQFFLTEGGEPLDSDGLKSMLRRLREKTGVSHCNAHTFRHTFARNYLRRGGDMETLRRIMGHSSSDSTRRYIKLIIEDLKEKHLRVLPAGAFSGYFRDKLNAVK